MTDSQTRSANRRIVKNTAYMYVRLFTIMVIGLYTSRLVLEILGASDYGLFSVVGGVMAMFTFISSSLTSATSRFLNVEMGKKDGDVNRIFNINVLLHTGMACLIFLLAETIGLWYVCNHLNVVEGKQDDAVFVYQVAIVTACLGIMNSPYHSLLIAKERFNFLALLDIINSLVRLGCILFLSLYRGEYSLRLYSIIFSLTTVNAFVIYHWIGLHSWYDIVRFRIVSGWQDYKGVLVYGNWNLLSSLSYIARSSGSDLLLNYFFGTAVNGAYAIGKTVHQCVGIFSGNFDSASSPQITQAYAAGDSQRVEYLVLKTGRFGLLLFLMVFFPLFIELDYVLHLWLRQVPDGALLFVQLYLIITGISLSGGGLGALISAYGRIKWFQLETSIFFLACIPLGFWFFSIGFAPYYILVLFIVADILHRMVQLTLVRFLIGFNSWHYVKETYLRPAVIVAVMTAWTCMYNQYSARMELSPWVIILATGLVVVAMVMFVGMTCVERQMIFKKLCSAIKN